jgi:hypothetical protein
MPFNQIKYYDHLSILIVNNSGIVKRLYVPFRVTCAVPIDKLKFGVIVYVDGVYSDREHKLVYQINGLAIPYHYFTISINF